MNLFNKLLVGGGGLRESTKVQVLVVMLKARTSFFMTVFRIHSGTVNISTSKCTH